MNITLLWTGREYYSLERCEVKTDIMSNQIKASIVGHYEGKIYQVDYQITTNAEWQTISANISCRFGGETQNVNLKNNGSGQWIKNGEPASEFDRCLDIDLPLTPFTNTLPIRRLKLAPGQSREIKVIYCDVLARELRAVKQKYTCLSSTEYHYENIPNDFEATIIVDEHGLVVDYPELFVRTAIEI